LRLNIKAVDRPPVPETEVLPFRVEENSSAGTVIGTLTAIDPDPVFSHLTDGDFSVGARPLFDITRFAANGDMHGSSIGSWEVVSGNVSVRGGLWESGPDGGYAVDLNGDTTGVNSLWPGISAAAMIRLN